MSIEKSNDSGRPLDRGGQGRAPPKRGHEDSVNSTALNPPREQTRRSPGIGDGNTRAAMSAWEKSTLWTGEVTDGRTDGRGI